MRKLISLLVFLPLICFVLLFSAVSFNVVSTQDLVNVFSEVVEIAGKQTLSSNFELIGKRYDKKDNYTGGYKCDADNQSGEDVAYGGCKIDNISLRLKGKIDTQAGKAKIRVKTGLDEKIIETDENGFMDESIHFTGGSGYIIVEYESFTGTVDITTEYE